MLSSRASGSRPFFILYLSAAVLPAFARSDDDDDKGKKGYKFDKEDDDWDKKGKNSLKNDNWDDSGHDDGKWHGDSSTVDSSTTDWSASESTTTTSKWQKSTDLSSITSMSSTSTSLPMSSTSISLSTSLVPTRLPAAPQARHVNPVAIAVPLAICGLIGFIALLVCAKRRSATTRVAPGPTEVEKEQSMLQQQSISSQGVTITKREDPIPKLGYQASEYPTRSRSQDGSVVPMREDEVLPLGHQRAYSQRSMREPRYESSRHSDYDSHPHSDRPYDAPDRGHVPQRHSDNHRMDDIYAYRLRRSNSRYDRGYRSDQSQRKSSSLLSDPTSRSDSCVTPYSRNTHDYFTQLPSRRSRHDYEPRYSPTRRSSHGDCTCSHCSNGHKHYAPTREPSRRSEASGSLFNPYSDRPQSLRSAQPVSSHRDSRYSYMEREHSLGSMGTAPTAEGLYESLRVALQSPRR